MSKEAIDLFREKVNLNTEWQEDVRKFVADDSPEKLANYANGKGYKYPEHDNNVHMTWNIEGGTFRI